MNSVADIEPIVKQVSPTTPESHHHKWWERIVVRFQAKRRARKIMNSLNEVNQIKSGRKTAKSFDDFLGEL